VQFYRSSTTPQPLCSDAEVQFDAVAGRVAKEDLALTTGRNFVDLEGNSGRRQGGPHRFEILASEGYVIEGRDNADFTHFVCARLG
jgi:hypothetical protein